MSDSAAESQAADAGRGDDSTRHGHPERVRRMIDIGPGTAAADGHSFGSGIDASVFDWCEIDHQGVIGNPEPARVVATATNGEQHIVFPREIHARDHVGDIYTLR